MTVIHAPVPVTQTIETQLVVVGGGLAGVCAAVAAARNGTDVVLIQERSVLGGNSSSEIRVGPSGATQNGYHRDARETGIIEEMVLETRARSYGLRQVNGSHYPMWDVILEETVLSEPRITLLLDTRVVSVETAPEEADGYETRITGLVAVQQGTEASLHITADQVVDASGDGFVAYQAGAPFRYGREASAEFGEAWAPDEADDVILGSSIMFAARDVGRPVPFTPPAWAHSFPDEESLPFREHSSFDHGYWWIEWGGRLNTITDHDAIRRELHAAVFGVWDHIKNHCTEPGVRERASTWALDWVGQTPGKRESRRFEGDHILTERDVSRGIDEVPDDVVAFGGWPIDLHAADGVYSPEQPCTQPPLPDRYGLPLRSMYARTVSNLFLAGRNISQSHVAHGSTRVMKTCAVIGQAVGTAAAVAIANDVSPRQVAGCPDLVAEIQQRLLRQGAYLPTVASTDECDLVRREGVRIAASSEAELAVDLEAPANLAWEVYGISTADAPILEAHRANHPGGQPHPLDRVTAQSIVLSEGRLDRVRVRVRNERDTPQTVTAQIRQAAHLRDFGPRCDAPALLATVSGTAAPGDGWVEFDMGESLVVTAGAPVVLALLPAAGVSWLLTLQEPPGTQAVRWDEELGYWRMIHGTFALEVLPGTHPYGANQVATGMTRPEAGTNVWISDPATALPQHVALTWPETVTIGSVEVTFDSQLSGWLWEGVFPLVTRDYRVDVRGDDGVWQTVVHDTGNHQRRRVHTFDPVPAREMRVVIEATNGGNTARIVEIRAYR